MDSGAITFPVLVEATLCFGNRPDSDVSSRSGVSWTRETYFVWPALPAVLINRARSCPVRKFSFGAKSQSISSVAGVTRRRVKALSPFARVSLSAKMDRTLPSELIIWDQTLGPRSAYRVPRSFGQHTLCSFHP